MGGGGMLPGAIMGGAGMPEGSGKATGAGVTCSGVAAAGQANAAGAAGEGFAAGLPSEGRGSRTPSSTAAPAPARAGHRLCEPLRRA